MGLLLNLGWVLVPSDQVAARHYFLEQLNKPEYIWGIRAVCVMAAVLFYFLYQKLRGNMAVAEAAVSGEVMAADDSSADIDNVPVIEIDFSSESASTPEPVSASGSVAIEETEPVPAPEPVPVLESAPTPEQEPEPVLEDVPIMETVPELESALEPVSVLETAPTSESESEIKPVGKPVAVSKLPEPDAESNIWLWALVGVSVSIGGIVLLSIYRRKRRVA